MVQICLGSMAPRFGAMQTAILAKEKPPSFVDLQSMFLVEGNHVRTRSNALEGYILYTHKNGGRGCGQGRGGQGTTYENNSSFRPQDGNNQGTFGRKGASIPVRAAKSPPIVDNKEKSTTTKKSAERRRMNPLPQADNSRITPQTLTTKTMSECS